MQQKNFNLTIRQEQIITYLWDNLNRKEIASRLKISTKTVDGHIHTIYKKYEVHTIPALFRKLLNEGWLKP